MLVDMNKNKLCILIVLFALCTNILIAQTSVYSELLDYRLKNDEEFSVISNNAEITKNTYKGIRTKSFFNTELSTGQMLLNLDKNSTKFSMEPSIRLGTPILNNLAFSFKMPYSVTNKTNNFRQGFDLRLSADIYSQVRNQLRLEIDEAYQNMINAEKKLKLKSDLVEKKLLNDIKQILSEYMQVLAKQLDTVRANIEYKQTVAQGYSENSAKLRTAKLSLLSAEREQKEMEFSFSVATKTFLEDCGQNYDDLKIEDFFKQLALSIPKAKITSLDNLSENNYSVILKAEQEYKNTLIKNKIALNTFSLSGNVNFNSMKIQETINSQTIKSEEKSIGTGINMLLPGIKFSTGVIFPVNDANNSKLGKSSSPTLQFMVALNPIAMYDYSLRRKNLKLLSINEKVKLNKIKHNFQNEFKTIKIKKEKFEWQQKLSSEEIDIYKKNAEDHAQWFARGVISTLENLRAEIEYKKALIRYADANINVSIFNTDIKELFEDGENNEQ